ncbi:unnamed protein product [Candidula unifasciata]|uniref:Fibrous sheath-interacting protein 1 n=1 Tax=Candidula unifasciata TaxID=100452 RepID=A0A8S3YSZ8_9EUPU|nr:unnamed protein product [Candidula unifasciata]
MKEELSNYKRRIKEVENGWSSEANQFETSLESDQEDLQDMDPKLKEAFIKMRRLDKVLFEKIQIEKEVKRKRILLEKRMRQEIEDMTKGVTIPQDIKTNTDKFLALELPASHNEGVTMDEETDLPPVFQTQLEENEAMWRKREATEQSTSEDTETNGSTRAESSMKTAASSARSQAKQGNKSRQQKKDFIKRNKELASQTDQSIPMTDDEKKRLAELLEGLDDLPGPEDGAPDITRSQLRATLQPGEGYCPDADEMKSLSNIDDQLKTLMPNEDYISVLSARTVPQVCCLKMLYMLIVTKLQSVIPKCARLKAEV